MKYITIALAKGRLAIKALEVFSNIGIDTAHITKKTRKLVFTDPVNRLKFVLVKATDVPTYVEYGAADLGIVGKDTILEQGCNVYEMLDLGFGACKMAVAGKTEIDSSIFDINGLRVATKYPNIARNYFNVKKHKTIEIIKLSGSVELAPIVGLSDLIVDIVESGKTLEENGLSVKEDIAQLSARLIANRVSVKVESKRIMELVGKIREVV